MKIISIIALVILIGLIARGNISVGDVVNTAGYVINLCISGVNYVLNFVQGAIS